MKSLEEFIDKAWKDTVVVFGADKDKEKKFKETFFLELKKEFAFYRDFILWARTKGIDDEILKQMNWLENGANVKDVLENGIERMQFLKSIAKDEVTLCYASDKDLMTNNLMVATVETEISDGFIPEQPNMPEYEITEIVLPLNYRFEKEEEKYCSSDLDQKKR